MDVHRAPVILFAILAISACISYEAAPEDSTEPAEPVTCTTNPDCGKGEYCEKAIGECDGEGTCRSRPEFCTSEWNPVCGCDGETYSNRCAAASEGYNVAYEGECRVAE